MGRRNEFNGKKRDLGRSRTYPSVMEFNQNDKNGAK